jgi:hypothetical protein
MKYKLIRGVYDFKLPERVERKNGRSKYGIKKK